MSQIEIELFSAGALRAPRGLPQSPLQGAWEAPGLEHNWKDPGKDQYQVGLPTREDWISTRTQEASLQALVKFSVLAFHQRILTKLFFFYLFRSLIWDEKMAVSFVACVCCVWFPWFVFLLWKRNRSWLRDGKQTTFCQWGHSSCPPEGAVNSRSIAPCQQADHPCCEARKATRQRWAWGSATQLARGFSQLPPTPGDTGLK